MINPLLLDKGTRSGKINEIIDSIEEISLVFDKYFSSIVSNFNIRQYEDSLLNFENNEDPFDLLQKRYKIHPSILAFLGKQFENIFSFRNVSEVQIENEILCLNDKKGFP